MCNAMRHVTFVIHLLSIAAVCLLAPSQATALSTSSQEYQDCAALSRSTPAAALKQAKDWVEKTRSPEARHCHALSLFALKRYREAALELDKLYERTPPEDHLLSVNLLRQSARAWVLAEKTDRGHARFTLAIGRLQGLNKPSALHQRLLAETLVERGELLQQSGNRLSALQDLDHAVSLNILAERALIARARLYHEMGQPTLAERDARAALHFAPRNAEARKVLKQVVR